MSDFKERFFKIPNIETMLKVASPMYRDPNTYYEELIANEKDKNIAEKRLKVLEDLSVKDNEERLRLEIERSIRTRDAYLSGSDWTQLADAPLEQIDKKYYRKYRQYLRELPEDIRSGRLENVVLCYDKWKKWIESVRFTSGHSKYIP